MAVTPEEVGHIAALARLRLEEGEIEEMSVELSSILGHMEELRQVNVERVDPVASGIDQVAPLRPDEAGSDPLHLRAADIAPAWAEPFFVVPRLAALDADAMDAGGAVEESR